MKRALLALTVLVAMLWTAPALGDWTVEERIVISSEGFGMVPSGWETLREAKPYEDSESDSSNTGGSYRPSATPEPDPSEGTEGTRPRYRLRNGNDDLLSTEGKTSEQIYTDRLTAWRSSIGDFQWSYYDGNSPADREAISHIVGARDEAEAAYWTLRLMQLKGKYYGPLPSEAEFYALQEEIYVTGDEATLQAVAKDPPLNQGRELTAEELALFPPELGEITYARIIGDTVHIKFSQGDTGHSISPEIDEWEEWVWLQEEAEAALSGYDNVRASYYNGVKPDSSGEQNKLLEQALDALHAMMKADSEAQATEAPAPVYNWHPTTVEAARELEVELYRIYEEATEGRYFFTLADGQAAPLSVYNDIVVQEGSDADKALHGDESVRGLEILLLARAAKDAGFINFELPTMEEYLMIQAIAAEEAEPYAAEDGSVLISAAENEQAPVGTDGEQLLPEAGDEPETTDDPETTDEPEATDVPETTDEPEATDVPEESPYPTVMPDVEVVSYGAVTSMLTPNRSGMSVACRFIGQENMQTSGSTLTGLNEGISDYVGPWWNMKERYTLTIQETVNGEQIKHIGDHAFDNFDIWYKYFTVPDGVESIGSSAFTNQHMEYVLLPDTLTELAPTAFNCCNSLQAVSIPESVTTLKAGVFAGCDNLHYVVIPETVTEISDEFIAHVDQAKVQQVVIYGYAGSAAELYALRNGLHFVDIGSNGLPAEPTAMPVPEVTLTPEGESTLTPVPEVTLTPEDGSTLTPVPEVTLTPEDGSTLTPSPEVTLPPTPWPPQDAQPITSTVTPVSDQGTTQPPAQDQPPVTPTPTPTPAPGEAVLWLSIKEVYLDDDARTVSVGVQVGNCKGEDMDTARNVRVYFEVHQTDDKTNRAEKSAYCGSIAPGMSTSQDALLKLSFDWDEYMPSGWSDNASLSTMKLTLSVRATCDNGRSAYAGESDLSFQHPDWLSRDYPNVARMIRFILDRTSGKERDVCINGLIEAFGHKDFRNDESLDPAMRMQLAVQLPGLRRQALKSLNDALADVTLYDRSKLKDSSQPGCLTVSDKKGVRIYLSSVDDMITVLFHESGHALDYVTARRKGSGTADSASFPGIDQSIVEDGRRYISRAAEQAYDRYVTQLKKDLQVDDPNDPYYQVDDDEVLESLSESLLKDKARELGRNVNAQDIEAMLAKITNYWLDGNVELTPAEAAFAQAINAALVLNQGNAYDVLSAVADKRMLGESGHDAAYWAADPTLKTQELWGHFFSAVCRGDGKELQLIHDVFPQTYDMMCVQLQRTGW